MAFKGITFAGQNVTPKNDKTLYQAHYGDGILYGCLMALGSDSLNISAGEFIEGGAVIQVDGGTSVDLSGRVNTDGYIQVIFNVDMTQGEGMQWYPTFVESATTTFPTLTQNPTWWNGYIYQLELAVIQVSGSNLTSIYRSLGYSTLVSNNDLILNGEDKCLRIIDGNGTLQTLIGSNDGNYSYIGTVDGGSIVSGIRLYEGGTTGVGIASNGKDIVFRPNGHSDSTGQMYLDADGQLHGGHPRRTNSASGRSVAANTTTLICSVQVLKGGLYQIYLNGDFNPSASGTGQVQYGVGYAGPQSRSTIDSKYMAGGAHIYCMSSCIAQLAVNDYIYFNINAPVNGTVSGGISAVLIN